MSDYRLSIRKAAYQKLFDSCQLRANWQPRIEEAIATILEGRSRYEFIEEKTTVPWWFVGILHYRESTCSFKCHLHNGDPLTRRTVQVPKGRPTAPPQKGSSYTWEESAIDALVWKTYHNAKDTSIAAWLWRFELWNGFGYAMRGLNSEYLWGGCNHFGSPPHCGKFVADGRFDSRAESHQVGAAVLLWAMNQRGLLATTKTEVQVTLQTVPEEQTVAEEEMTELKGGQCDIRILRDTWFVQSVALAPELLPEDQKLFLPAGSVLPVLAWRSLPTNHLVVTLNNVVLKGRNTWHCSLDEVKMRLPKVATPAPAATPVIQHATPRPTVPGDLSSLPGEKVIRFMRSRDFRIRALNIVYLVNASAQDWSPLANTIDTWNDVRCIVRDTGEVLGSWQATTDPGQHYLHNWMNPKGCAILALGQHRDAWRIGLHHGHPALSQCDNLVIYRDRTKSLMRSGHTVIAGAECGINHHGTSGKDGNPKSIGRYSAGCCVGLYWKSHLQFIEFCHHSGNSRFDATLIDGGTLHQFA